MQFTTDLLRSLPAFHRANGEAEAGGARDVWNVHVVAEPLVPPEAGRSDAISPFLPLRSWEKRWGGVLPGVGAGYPLGVDVVAQLLSTVVYPSPDVDLREKNRAMSWKNSLGAAALRQGSGLSHLVDVSDVDIDISGTQYLDPQRSVDGPQSLGGRLSVHVGRRRGDSPRVGRHGEDVHGQL